MNGPPALCTMFARFGVFGPIDLVVSGINPGANVGRAVYHSGTVGAALTARNGGISAVAVSQAVAGIGIEGQGWDEMIADQHWQTAADVASSVVAEVVAVPSRRCRSWSTSTSPTSPSPTSRAGATPWSGRHRRAPSPRRASSRSRGTEDCFAVRMSWGDQIEAPPETDSGAIERDEVTISFLSRLEHEPRPDMTGIDAALDALVGSAS